MSTPDVRVRKYAGSWNVQKYVLHKGHWVWSLVASYTTWDVAFAVAQVEASPIDWPLQAHYELEQCS